MSLREENHIPDFIKQLQAADGLSVRVGVLSSDNGDLAAYAAANEFGARIKRGEGEIVIPERSYLRSTLDKPSTAKRILKAMLGLTKPGESARDQMDRAGVVLVGEVQEQIRRGDYAPNAPSTVAKKGSDRPLIDTGRLIQSISHEVVG